ncbi:rhomboid family intramembrane serine protease [Ascidiimonas aurantiaca]|uniref:rhomboid family intramembrane serine protease n=1 Tax=Ascidiimonas aurantiaca TaxID=1685432 RepID=UPI0030EE2827
MKEVSGFTFSNRVIVYPFLAVLCIWVVYWFEIRFGFDFTSYGIRPRTISGLKGVVFSPFIHSSAEHLYNNTFPLLLLMGSLIYFYRSISEKIILYGILLSGILTWLIGRDAYHIGASGLIYLLTSFMFFKGIFTGYYRLIAVSLIVVFLYGSLIWYLFPIDDGISWEGHLAGFVTGLLFSLVFQGTHSVETIPDQENNRETEDAFLKHFDEDGNFIPTSELERRKNEDSHDVG